MIVTISRDELAAAISKPCKIAKGQRDTHLACILVTARGDSVSVEANDLYESCAVTAPALVEEPGSALIGGKALEDIVRAMPDGAVTISGDASGVAVSGGRAEFSVPSLDPADFPSFPEPGAGDAVTVPADALAALVRATSYACAREGMGGAGGRAVEGVLVEVGEGRLRLTGTDGLCLARAWCAVEGAGSMREAFPAAVLADAAAACKGGDIELSASGAQLRMAGTSTVMTARSYSADYPNVDAFFAGEPTCTVRVGRASALDAARRAAVIGGTGAVGVGFDDGGMTLTRSSDRESMRETVDAEVSAPMEIGLNAKMLVNALANLPAGSVEMGIENPIKPLVMRAGDAEAIVMPVRLR